MKLVLLGFSCLDLMETTAFPTPLGFTRLIRSRPAVVSISGSCGFCLHSEFWVYSPLLGSFFFLFFFPSVALHPCNSASVYLQYVFACMTMSSLIPLMFLWAFFSAKGAHGSSNIQLSVSTSKADETKTAELKRQRSLDTSLPVGSPIQRPWPDLCVFCMSAYSVCERPRMWAGELNIRGQVSDTTQTRGRQEESGHKGGYFVLRRTSIQPGPFIPDCCSPCGCNSTHIPDRCLLDVL